MKEKDQQTKIVKEAYDYFYPSACADGEILLKKIADITKSRYEEWEDKKIPFESFFDFYVISIAQLIFLSFAKGVYENIPDKENKKKFVYTFTDMIITELFKK